MAITIPNNLNYNQLIKIFSNPVSGITCDFGVVTKSENWDVIKNIKYSKSMLLSALYFWERQYNEYQRRLKKAQFNPIFKNGEGINDPLFETIMFVQSLPNTFLFSHHYIKAKNTKYSDAMNIQLKLINETYPVLLNRCKYYGYQTLTMNPYYMIKTKELDISFTVFPNEFPYVKRSKIAEVGKTQKGNTFIIKKT